MHMGLVLGAIVYFCGAWDIFFPQWNVHQAKVGHLVGATVLCFLPLAILGVATDCIILPIIGAIGLFLDSLRVADLLSRQWHAFEVPIYAGVLAVTGLGIGALGMFLDNYKAAIQLWVKKCLICGLGTGGGGGGGGDLVLPEDATTPLVSTEA